MRGEARHKETKGKGKIEEEMGKEGEREGERKR